VPAIKGDMYTTHCNYSQPASIKLDNKNIGGHLTPLQSPSPTAWFTQNGCASVVDSTAHFLNCAQLSPSYRL